MCIHYHTFVVFGFLIHTTNPFTSFAVLLSNDLISSANYRLSIGKMVMTICNVLHMWKSTKISLKTDLYYCTTMMTTIWICFFDSFLSFSFMTVQWLIKTRRFAIVAKIKAIRIMLTDSAERKRMAAALQRALDDWVCRTIKHIFSFEHVKTHWNTHVVPWSDARLSSCI